MKLIHKEFDVVDQLLASDITVEEAYALLSKEKRGIKVVQLVKYKLDFLRNELLTTNRLHSFFLPCSDFIHRISVLRNDVIVNCMTVILADGIFEEDKNRRISCKSYWLQNFDMHIEKLEKLLILLGGKNDL